MALVTCPECAAQVSERATACPGCGHPLAVADAGADPLAMLPGERVLFTVDTRVRITSQRAVIDGATFHLRNIDAVTKVMPPSSLPGALVLMGLSVFVAFASLFIAVIMLIVSIVWLVVGRQRYVVRLKGHGGEVDALVSTDDAHVTATIDALNKALAEAHPVPVPAPERVPAG